MEERFGADGGDKLLEVERFEVRGVFEPFFFGNVSGLESVIDAHHDSALSSVADGCACLNACNQCLRHGYWALALI